MEEIAITIYCFNNFALSPFHLSDDFPESTGIKRIIQALNANVWSSVNMKDGEMTQMQASIALLAVLFNLPIFLHVWHVSVC